MKKGELKKLLKAFDTPLDVKAVGDDKLQVRYGDKTFERTVASDAGISQALVELKEEQDNYSFSQAFKPADTADNKTDGKEGMKKDNDNRNSK